MDMSEGNGLGSVNWSGETWPLWAAPFPGFGPGADPSRQTSIPCLLVTAGWTSCLEVLPDFPAVTDVTWDCKQNKPVFPDTVFWDIISQQQKGNSGGTEGYGERQCSLTDAGFPVPGQKR